jgi:demethylmenaquinone methyltransferase/2-methoxy-6-polyprenyl-1,4-benzoquinol methylase
MQVKPYEHSEESKKKQVETMFNSISPTYDALNRYLSFGIDVYWRKLLVKAALKNNPSKILDMATGTADVALALAKKTNAHIIGADISENMLAVGRQKVLKKNKQAQIVLETGDSENLKYPDNTFDAVTAAFGVRNFENLSKGLSELCRVAKPGSDVIILEFSKPRNPLVKALYGFYKSVFIPFIGKLISKDYSAYKYLNDSVEAFPDGEEFLTIARNSGFSKVSQQRVTFGVVSLYTCQK